MRKEEKYGVTYYFGNDPMTCCDMDINPGITTAKIYRTNEGYIIYDRFMDLWLKRI